MDSDVADREKIDGVPTAVDRPVDVERYAERLEGESAKTILRWTWASFGERAIVTSSFQTQSVPLLHLIGRVVPQLAVVFLDTGFHFPETLAFRDRVVDRFGLNLRVMTNDMGHESFRAQYGELYRRDPDLCCHINKVEPLERALETADAWISGIRRDQTEARRNTPVIQRRSDGTLKICPMVEWTGEEVDNYIDSRQLPTHPLTEQGYPSVGCAPCTECPADGDDPRGGRWAGRDKTECGLHIDEGGDASDEGLSGKISIDE